MISVLICTTNHRADLLNRLLDILVPQLYDDDEILIDDTEDIEIGTKRNNLINKAKEPYCVFIDDDDIVSDDYIDEIRKVLEHGVDRCLISMDMYVNGKYTSRSVPKHLAHLHPTKTSIFKYIKFNQISNGEDTDFTYRLKYSGLISSEMLSNATYTYLFIEDPNKPRSSKKYMSYARVNKLYQDSEMYKEFIKGNL